MAEIEASAFLAQSRRDGTVVAGGGKRKKGKGKGKDVMRIICAMIPVVANHERSINELRDRCSWLVVMYDEACKRMWRT